MALWCLCILRCSISAVFALLDSYRGKKLAKLWLKALGVLLLCMIVIVAVANATGVVDTSAT